MPQRNHDAYGRKILTVATSGEVSFDRDARRIPVQGRADVDAVIGNIAVEVESSRGKRVHAAILHLYLHSAPNKLLIRIPAHPDGSDRASQSREIVNCLHKRGLREPFEIVSLQGKAGSERLRTDVAEVKRALRALGWKESRRRGTP